MDKKTLPMTQEHKDKISLGTKGIHLNKSAGKVIFKDGKKLCPSCDNWKTEDNYDKRPERPLGLKPKCKQCAEEYRALNKKNNKFTMYKSGAKKRGIDWRLSKEEFLQLWQKDCNYCGDPIETIGVDRIDSEHCYSIYNIVPCCVTCNVMKLALKRDDFINHCKKVIRNYESNI